VGCQSSRDAKVREVAEWLQAAFEGGHALHRCSRHTLPLMRAKRTRRWHISESTSRGEWNGDVTLAPGVPRRGARSRPCSRAV